MGSLDLAGVIGTWVRESQLVSGCTKHADIPRSRSAPFRLWLYLRGST
jgi:hypothetical protein